MIRTIYDTNTTTEHNFNNNSKMVRTSNGILFCVFTNYTSKYSIRYGKSIDNGNTWTTGSVYFDATYNQLYPNVAIDSNDVLHFMWRGRIAGQSNYNVLYRNYTPSTDTWGSVTVLSDDSIDIVETSMVVDMNNYVHVYFIQASRLKTRRWNGSSWGSTIIIYYAQPKWHCAAVSKNNIIHVSFTETGGYDDIYYTRSINNGTSYSTPVMISDNIDFDQRISSIATDENGGVYIAWYGAYAGMTMTQIRFISSNDYGVTWSNITNITNDSIYSQVVPMITWENNKIHIFWQAYQASIPTFYNIRHIEYNGSWGTAEFLTNDSTENNGYVSALSMTNPFIPREGYCFIFVDNDIIKFYSSDDILYVPSDYFILAYDSDDVTTDIILNQPVRVTPRVAKKITKTRYRDHTYKIRDVGKEDDEILIEGVIFSGTIISGIDALDGEEITLIGMHDSNFDDIYFINNFNYQYRAGGVGRWYYTLGLKRKN